MKHLYENSLLNLDSFIFPRLFILMFSIHPMREYGEVSNCMSECSECLKSIFIALYNVKSHIWLFFNILIFVIQIRKRCPLRTGRGALRVGGQQAGELR